MASSPDGGTRQAELQFTFEDASELAVPVTIEAPPREHFSRGFWLNPAVDVLIARSPEFTGSEVAAKLAYGRDWLVGLRYYRFHFIGNDITTVAADDTEFLNAFDAGAQSLVAVANPLDTIRARLADIPIQPYSYVTVFAFSNGLVEAPTPISTLFTQHGDGQPAPPRIAAFLRNSPCPTSTSAWFTDAANAQPPAARLLDVCQSNYDTEMTSIQVNDWNPTTRLYFDGSEFRPSFTISYDGVRTTEWDVGNSSSGEYYQLRQGSFESHRQFTVEYDLLSACERGGSP